MELSSLIARHARFRPRATAVVFEDARLDYAAYSRYVNRLANALAALGVRRGDRVATLLPNCLELLSLYWASARLGAVAVPLSPLLTGSGLASLIGDAGAIALLTRRDLLPAVDAVIGGLPSLTPSRVLVTDGAAGTPYADLPAALAGAADSDPPHPGIGPDDLFNIMYTSGTTGLPKGIMHSHRVRATYALTLGAAWRMTPESVVLHTGAIVFNGAFVTLMPAFHLGATYVLHRQFDAGEMIATIARENVTHIMVVPAQIIALLDHPDFAPEKLASLQMILSLGAPLARERKDQLNRLLPGRFHELYGLTEGFVTILDRTDAERKAGSVGCPPVFSDVRIVDDAGRVLPPGEAGEIVGRGPMMMQGYWNKPELTAQTLRDGWIFSGDVGYLDEEGYLYLIDRKKDMIDSGGVKVYPKDVEEVAARHPAVAEVAVFGVPSDKWGETPLAAVVLKSGARATAEELRDWINERVGARYQRVSAVEIRDSFPRNAAGKTLKREMRDAYWRDKATRI